ncbi:uncharacterized protein SPAPADRAFT_139200 [Spathaspora passalidarum NRRL Y-27907]|uniref:Mitochondrial inner membrane protease subunit n=1 Tax=Spathaspora passalidarum (strain NRRL Y-27907 / 11-Y1) TaxID=619300 RepID=G3APC7_SPAPN|nr:uncharacterized protein SPAPADRAFT_139200 [Spathaspora passalidarum NRRL Y-27907]EGW32104.1 hypothetical protein SPAPADRAFT_139200 [Spathaspora passalidarum NRRL Y-27907]
MALSPPVRNTLLALTWVPVLHYINKHFYQPYQIRGISMTPTFNPGTTTTTNDIVLVRKYNLRKPTSVDRGDIIMFRSPEDPEKLLTKRIVGMQGDTIKPRDTYPKREVIVPRSHLWVEGDNLAHSVDSNKFGCISQGLLVGKVIMVVWPLSRFGCDLQANN